MSLNHCIFLSRLQMTYNSRNERRSQRNYITYESLSAEELLKLPELSPPGELMPHGNIGTPSATFYQLINDCKLPSR